MAHGRARGVATTRGSSPAAQNGERRFMELLGSQRTTLAAVLPKHITPERQLRMALITFRREPKLQECEPMTIIGCLINASQLGLEIGGAAHEAALVPFKRTCTLVVEYPGLIKLAMQSGMVRSINPDLVYENDLFEHNRATGECEHRSPREGLRGKLQGAYCCIVMQTGGTRTLYMTVQELEHHGQRYTRDFEGRWGDKKAAYYQKTVVRLGLKFVPRSPKLSDAIAFHDAAEGGGSYRPVDNGNWDAPSTDDEGRPSVIDVTPSAVEDPPGESGGHDEAPPPPPTDGDFQEGDNF